MFIGSRLKDLRIKNNMTQTELGQKVKVTKVSICCYEKGVRIPTLETLEDLAGILNVSCDFLLGNDKLIINNKETIKVSEELLQFIKEIKNNKKLYNKIIKEPKKVLKNMIDNKIGDIL